jgi:hypothetical protein
MAITDPVLLSPRAGDSSRLLDGRWAGLVEELRSPRTLVEAVIRYSRARGLDPESTLVEAYPLLERLLAAGVLVPAGSAEGDGLGPAPAEALLARVLDRLDPDGPLFRDGLPVPPRASVSHGAAGIACGLHRIALARGGAALLRAADLWAAKAAAETGEGAFHRPGSGLVPETLGRVSPYHTASGIHAVRAMIARASGDPVALRRELSAFVALAGGSCPNPDLTLGRSGSLLAAALLLDLLDEPSPELGSLGDSLLAGLWAELDGLPPVADCAGRPNLGMAHGWAGCLYASLRWCRAAGRPLPARLPGRLAELAEQAQGQGRSLRWRWYDEGGKDIGTIAGWCNGSAGFVFLWSLAHRMLGSERYLALAEGAAWDAWEAPGDNGTLCCGLAGRAYALLHLHGQDRGGGWLPRARELADRAAAAIERTAGTPDSLYKGALGVAVLAADLARPAGAAFPFFES